MIPPPMTTTRAELGRATADIGAGYTVDGGAVILTSDGSARGDATVRDRAGRHRPRGLRAADVARRAAPVRERALPGRPGPGPGARARRGPRVQQGRGVRRQR